MKVKRYIVDDVPEAVKLIRNELGSDAVILNTKDIRVGGFLGMFSKKRVEVIAAVDESTRNTTPRTPLPAVKLQERESVEPATERLTSTGSLPYNAVRERYTQAPFADSGRNKGLDSTALGSRRASSEPAQAVAALSTPVAVAELPMEETTSLNKETRGSKQDKDETSALLLELRSMKEMMTKLASQQAIKRLPESVLKWSKRLAEQGVDPAYVEQFAEEVNLILVERGEDSFEAAYEASRAVVLSWLDGIRGAGIEPSTRIVHFVGPTGVGKTTTIAKLAAEQSFRFKRNVGFITADTYRIAAVDQLRTYADILNIPLEVVFSPSELTRVYKKLSDHDLLFMDTAGRNYRNELFVSEVNSLLSPGEQKETILVLSMTHKYKDMKLVASQFAKYGVNQLLLTKFDETDSYGSVINLAKEFGFQISYITCGQAVPDDIRLFDPEEWVSRLLGDPSDE